MDSRLRGNDEMSPPIPSCPHLAYTLSLVGVPGNGDETGSG